MGGTRVSEFFTKNPNLFFYFKFGFIVKTITNSCTLGGRGRWGGGLVAGGWAGVSDVFYHESKFKYFFLGGGGVG